MKPFKKRNKPARIAFFVLLVTLITCVGLSTTLAKYTTDFDFTGNAMVASFDVSATVNGLSDDIFGTIYDLLDAPGQTSTYTQIQAGFWANPVDEEDPDVITGKIAPGVWGKISLIVRNDSEVAVGWSVTNLAITNNGLTIGAIKALVDDSNAGELLEKELDHYAQINGYDDMADAGTSLDATVIKVPLLFSLEPTNPTSWVTADQLGTLTTTLAGTLARNTSTTSSPDVLYWKWDFENGSNLDAGSTGTKLERNDNIDTILGLAAALGEFNGTKAIKATMTVNFVQIDKDGVYDVTLP